MNTKYQIYFRISVVETYSRIEKVTYITFLLRSFIINIYNYFSLIALRLIVNFIYLFSRTWWFRLLINNFSNTYGNINSWQGTQGFKDTELRNQLLLDNSKSNSMDGDEIGTSHDQRNNVTRKQAKVSCDEHTDRQTLNRAYQKEEDANKTDAPVGSRPRKV